MNLKSIVLAILAFVVPWLIFASGIAFQIYNALLYVGSITWFLTSLFIYLSFYKI
ncbi:MAG: hypothetical protein J7K61_01115 [Thermoplasmata archaeon]|nr:hypothetical protein [Thermoplasmata archaeon]